MLRSLQCPGPQRRAGGPEFPLFHFHFESVGAPSLRFLQGRVGCCRYHGIRHAQRIASYVRRASPALYHLFLLSTIAISKSCAESRPLPRDSRTGAPAIPIRGRRIRRDARTYSSFDHGTGDWKSVEGHAGSEAAHGARLAAEAQTEQPATAKF